MTLWNITSFFPEVGFHPLHSGRCKHACLPALCELWGLFIVENPSVSSLLSFMTFMQFPTRDSRRSLTDSSSSFSVLLLCFTNSSHFIFPKFQDLSLHISDMPVSLWISLLLLWSIISLQAKNQSGFLCLRDHSSDCCPTSKNSYFIYFVWFMNFS